LGRFAPYDPSVPSPEEFLGYGIGEYHTRHDRIVAYFETLAQASEQATLASYGATHEGRSLVILTISSPENLGNLEELQKTHLQVCNPRAEMPDIEELPVFVNLGYNVHGNEPSTAEAAILAAYTLVASQHEAIIRYRNRAIVFVDPTLNPDGRDRHTQWANSYRGDPLVSDPFDAEHNESWPRGRTNHYWFDLNRDWLLGIHPESRGKLRWYHQWYPSVVTDFHEMGTNSTYFFEPMKTNGSKKPIMPKENYTTLNDTFAQYFARDLDELGSLYFSKEVFDGTYPGYGSSYPDLQGGLGILFEQASSRGHVQETRTGKITFPFTIRNQYTSSFATVQAAVEHRHLLHQYLRDFFESALSNAAQDPFRAYVFAAPHDPTRERAFLDKLLLHKVKFYPLKEDLDLNGNTFKAGEAFVVPTEQVQYRMVQTCFETYEEYTDSVYYDASAWSLANFYNLTYTGIDRLPQLGEEVTELENLEAADFSPAEYAYLIPWNDYAAPAFLYQLQLGGVQAFSAFKPFRATLAGETKDFDAGTLMIPLAQPKISKDSLFRLVRKSSNQWGIPVYPTNTGYSSQGIDLGSRYMEYLAMPKALLLIGEGVSSYEAGEVWHLLDQRVKMPITKLRLAMFDRAKLDRYNVLVMVSGSYAQLAPEDRRKISDWVGKGNTLITIREGTSWAIRNGLVNETLRKPKQDTSQIRLP
ncbi:MAG: M14 family zinc carboxypeptidase, partial [Bacteroidota bacterium]